MEETKDYGKNFLKSKVVKAISIIAVVAIVVVCTSLTFYRHEKNKLFNNISTDIVNLNRAADGFRNGLNQNAQFLNPSFAQNYQNDFTKLISSMQEYQGSMLNNTNSKSVLSKEIAKAKYYDYMTQFTAQAVSHKNDFAPLTNAVQNGKEITTQEAQKMENDLQTLENSSALTQAMNIYNSQNIYMDREIKSPYTIKQSIINLNQAIQKGDFNKIASNKAATSKANQKNNNENDKLLVMNLI